MIKNKTIKNGVGLNRGGGGLVSSILHPCVQELPKALYSVQLNWFLFTLRNLTWPFNYTHHAQDSCAVEQADVHCSPLVSFLVIELIVM